MCDATIDSFAEQVALQLVISTKIRNGAFHNFVINVIIVMLTSLTIGCQSSSAVINCCKQFAGLNLEHFWPPYHQFKISCQE